MKAQDFKIFMRQAHLEMQTKALWCLILTWANKDGSNAFPTIEKLAHISGMKERWVKKHLAILKKKGYIEVTKERMHGARYNHNVYRLKTRGTVEHLTGCTGVPTTKSLNQNAKLTSVESEAILRALPDPVREDSEQYGVRNGLA